MSLSLSPIQLCGRDTTTWSDVQIHWLAICNSVAIVLFLSVEGEGGRGRGREGGRERGRVEGGREGEREGGGRVERGREGGKDSMQTKSFTSLST